MLSRKLLQKVLWFLRDVLLFLLMCTAHTAHAMQVLFNTKRAQQPSCKTG